MGNMEYDKPSRNGGDTPRNDPYWMDRSRKTGPRKLPPKRPKTLDRRRAEIMRDWFGDRAAREILTHRHPARSIGGVVEEVLGKYLRAPDLTLVKLQQAWKEAVGPAVAAQSLPVRLDQKVLWIEVANEAWRYNLERLLREEILQAVQRIAGNDNIRDVRFVPAGRRRPRPGTRGRFRY